MADYVAVANMALTEIGETVRLTDPDDDTHPARTIKAVWAMVRRATLRDHRYNFSIKRARLGKVNITDPNDVIEPWTSAFALPTDFVRLDEIATPSGLDRFSVENNRILANEAGPLTIAYIRDVPDIGSWDDLAVKAFALHLAFVVSDPISGDTARKDIAWKHYQETLKPAKRVDAIENPPIEAYDSSWVTARWAPPDGIGSSLNWSNP